MMDRREFVVNAAVAGSLLGTSGVGFGQEGTTPAAAARKTGYAPVNGVKLYYEIWGSGSPLILLHGGLGSIDMFSSILAALSHARQVVAVDLQAHGYTGDLDRPMTWDAMADDMAGLLKFLQIERADVMGYSLGGGVAIRTAVRYPNAVRKLVAVSVPCKRDGWYADIRAQMAQIGPQTAEMMKPSPLYQHYAKVAPQPDDWTQLVVKVGKLINIDYDWSKDVAGIKAPTMLVFGDADSVRPEHIVEFFQLLGGGKKDGGWDGSGVSHARLAVLPGVTHYNISEQPALAAAVIPFLDTPMPGAQ